MKTIQAACTVIRREDGAILMVKRLNPPEAGLWSVPGGKVEPGESLRAAAVRRAAQSSMRGGTGYPALGTSLPRFALGD
ncbi:NUDIX domain-containing protein [Billgrantia aerodenitrificans]